MKKFNWGIIGTGRIANTFAQALAGCGEAVCYAAASRTREKAEAFAQKYGFEKSYGSYKELAEDENVDVVYIATPMSCHYGDALLCIKNGKNVLCEKSAALSLSQLDEMLKAANENNVFFMEAMWMKCRPVYLKALEWAKRIGRIEYIKADFCNLVQYDPKDRLFDPGCGGGALLDLAVYPLTLAYDFLGEPEEIITAAHIGRGGVDLSNSIMLKYNNAAASLNSSFEIPNNNSALISAENGMIIFSDWFFCTSRAALCDRDGKELEVFDKPNEINGYEYEIREVCRCLSEGIRESPLVPHSSTRAVMRIMDKCRADWGMRYPQEK